MRSTGMIVFSIGLIGLSLVFGLAKLTMHVDSIQGEYHSNWYKYLNAEMLIPVLVTLIIGLVLCKKKN
ncbi:hypothetical protein [Peribacillus acanthi]|uniref:hypothetical protein n=1 Tax=Peribacillus acanthi TaxID=2171554 RepID=UPI000D3E3698|nr:hypothetical protein [Peribacillus acanthi]